MLKHTPPPFRLPDVKLTHISLALVGLMWVFPFLHYRHQPPITSFDQEWWSALFGVLALVLLVARDYWMEPQIPRIAQLPVALIAVVFLQWALGKIVYFDQALLYVLYLLFAALLMLLGERLRDHFGMAQLARTLAIFLLLGAEVSALIGMLQHFHLRTLLDTVIAAKISAGVYGNLAQPNHFANYISLGLVSLGLLLQQRKLAAGYAAIIAAPLLLVLALSGSRSVLLYLLLMAGLSWWCARRDRTLRVLLRYSLLLMAGFGLMYLLLQVLFVAGPDMASAGGYNPLQRLGDTTSGGLRLYLWREAVLMFMQSPWLGVGFGQFAWHHFLLAPELQQSNITGLYNNAHNLIFQLAAETGITGLLILFVALGVWLKGVRRVPPDAAHWWGYSVLGVVAIHSLLEYPLWYAYFVAVVAILLGALDETRYRLELRNAGRLSVAAVLLMGFATLWQLQTGYRKLEHVWLAQPLAGDKQASERIRDDLIAVHGGSLFSSYAELKMSERIEINDEHLKEKLALSTRLLRTMPIGSVGYRQALLLAQDGQHEQARSIWECATWSYPEDYDRPRQVLVNLAEKDPVHFSALLEFAFQKEQEFRRAVH